MPQRKASKRPFRTLYYLNGVRVRTGHATTYTHAVARAASWIAREATWGARETTARMEFSTVIEDCLGNTLHALDTVRVDDCIARIQLNVIGDY